MKKWLLKKEIASPHALHCQTSMAYSLMCPASSTVLESGIGYFPTFSDSHNYFRQSEIPLPRILKLDYFGISHICSTGWQKLPYSLPTASTTSWSVKSPWKPPVSLTPHWAIPEGLRSVLSQVGGGSKEGGPCFSVGGQSETSVFISVRPLGFHVILPWPEMLDNHCSRDQPILAWAWPSGNHTMLLPEKSCYVTTVNLYWGIGWTVFIVRGFRGDYALRDLESSLSGYPTQCTLGHWTSTALPSSLFSLILSSAHFYFIYCVKYYLLSAVILGHF